MEDQKQIPELLGVMSERPWVQEENQHQKKHKQLSKRTSVPPAGGHEVRLVTNAYPDTYQVHVS